MSAPGVDLELYVEILDYLTERQPVREGKFTAPRWSEALNDWARGRGLEGERLEYFAGGVTRLAGHPWKAGPWEDEPRDEELDMLVWTYHRVWVDRYGPVYPPSSRSQPARPPCAYVTPATRCTSRSTSTGTWGAMPEPSALSVIR